MLMEQKNIAGIGNIYADEILFKAGVLPDREIKSLSDKEIESLHSSIKAILKEAVSLRGTSTSDYRDTFGRKGKYASRRAVYRRTGEPCVNCGMPIERKKLGGRSAHFCKTCQK